jgi:hypothetical protein
MGYPLVTGALITATDFNEIITVQDQIMGLNDDGWGLSLTSGIPAAAGLLITAWDTNSVIKDLNIIQGHIDNTTTSTSWIITGTTLVAASPYNAIKARSDYYLDPSRRWTCHPEQFRKSNTVTNDILFFRPESTSTRTIVWGETATDSIRTITHKVVASWPTRLQARYYFNQGNFLGYRPYHFGDGLNDLDTEWANFINWISTSADYRYTRNEFVTYEGLSGTSTVYTSGTLSVSILAVKSSDETSVTFTIDFFNSDTADLIVTPAVAYYTILV